MEAATAAVPLLLAGYPVSVVVIARWVPVVRERRTRWFAAHAAAVLAIIIGWALRRPVAMVPNIAWLVASAIWYRVGAAHPPRVPEPDR